MFAFTAANFVPVSNAGTHQRPITANDLKPAECAGLDLSRVAGGPGITMGTEANELLLGSNIIDAIDGQSGSDCIVGGPADDVITGGPGTDVCIGGAGNDTFVGCETEYQ